MLSRSLGWRWKDPSRKFLIPGRSLGWRWKDPSVSWKFLFPGEAVTGLEVERSVSEVSYSQEISWKFLFQGEAVTGLEVERSVSEIRLGSREKKNSQRRSPSKKMVRARVESSPRSPSFRAAAPLPIELWILASPAQRLQCQRASPADRLSGE